MTMVGLPMNLFEVEGDDMGDLEYIESKVVASEYFQVSGDITGGATIESSIIANGKTAFMIEAKLTQTDQTFPSITTISGASASNKDAVTAAFQFVTSGPTTTIKDKTIVGWTNQVRSVANGGLGGATQLNSNKFNVLGLSLVGDGTNTKIQIENVLDGGSAWATFSYYLSDT